MSATGERIDQRPMSVRKTDEEIAFGTDSFLDVVCNLVGILIILIIVAGMRMTQTPAEMIFDDLAPPPLVAHAAPAVIEPPVVPIPEPEPITPEVRYLPPAEAPPELTARAD